MIKKTMVKLQTLRIKNSPFLRKENPKMPSPKNKSLKSRSLKNRNQAKPILRPKISNLNKI